MKTAPKFWSSFFFKFLEDFPSSGALRHLPPEEQSDEALLRVGEKLSAQPTDEG